MGGGQVVLGRVELAAGRRIGLVAALSEAVAGWVRLVALLGPSVLDK